jgi:hypothetical protein
MQPEEVTRLVAERLNAGDAAGMTVLYEPQAVPAYPAGQPVTGREAIQANSRQMADAGATFAVETTLPTVRFEDLALTAAGTPPRSPAMRPAGSCTRQSRVQERAEHNRAGYQARPVPGEARACAANPGARIPCYRVQGTSYYDRGPYAARICRSVSSRDR